MPMGVLFWVLMLLWLLLGLWWSWPPEGRGWGPVGGNLMLFLLLLLLGWKVFGPPLQ